MPKFFIAMLITLSIAVTSGCDANGAAKSESESQSSSSELKTGAPVSEEELPDRTDGEASSNENRSSEDSPSGSPGNIPFSLKLLAWNVESEGSDPATIVRQMSDFKGYDLIALTEVLPDAADMFTAAFGDSYDSVLTKSGGNDRMMLIYNRNALNLLRHFELDDINYKYRYRSPLVGHFQNALTGREMLIMVNHLARGSEQARQVQAKDLVEWARDQTLPIVALGDYNFDYEFSTRKGNEAFRLFMKDNVFRWVEPIELIDTNWYDNPRDPDGEDDYPGNMLDFCFVAGAAKEWRTSCKIIVREGDFPDNEMTADHRPYEMIVSGK